MEMKRILIFIICWIMTVMFLSSARAIDRSPKSNDSDQKKETTEIKEGKAKRSFEVTRKTNLPSEKATVKDDSQKNAETKTVEGKEKYDYFLDRNNNGIDDRLEGNLKAKETKKPEIIKRKISTTPEKTTPKATPVVKPKEKVEERKSNEPRKEEIPAKIEKKRGSEKK
jgi:hypothetical protein